MIRTAPALHPSSSKWYWGEWPASELDGATIATSTWTVPAGLALDAEAIDGLAVGVRLSVDGASEGDVLDVVNRITTSSGETLHETVRIRIHSTGH